MPVHKRKRNGKVTWYFKFDAPGSTREHRNIVREFGFEKKGDAQDAERVRFADELKKIELAKSGASGIAAALPTTLAMLMDEFLRQHAEERPCSSPTASARAAGMTGTSAREGPG